MIKKLIDLAEKGILPDFLIRSGIKRMGYSDEFLRMWDYYFIYCEAGFRERFIGDVQLVMAKPENKNIQINY